MEWSQYSVSKGSDYSQVKIYDSHINSDWEFQLSRGQATILAGKIMRYLKDSKAYYEKNKINHD